MNYNTVDPIWYERRHERIPRENYLKKHWNPIIIKAIEKYSKNKIVLDLGCGTGIYTSVIKKNTDKVFGIDISKNFLTYAKMKNKTLTLIQADAHNLPLKPSSFDCIVAIGLFEYVDKCAVLKEINRTLKKMGTLLILVPNKYSAFRIIIKFFSKLSRKVYAPQEPSQREMLWENGFRVMECKMDDGLIWLPDFLDKMCGKSVYHHAESFFKIFGQNSFSCNMLFVCKKWGR